MVRTQSSPCHRPTTLPPTREEVRSSPGIVLGKRVFECSWPFQKTQADEIPDHQKDRYRTDDPMPSGKEEDRRRDQSKPSKSLGESCEADYACRNIALREAEHRYADDHDNDDENGYLLTLNHLAGLRGRFL